MQKRHLQGSRLFSVGISEMAFKTFCQWLDKCGPIPNMQIVVSDIRNGMAYCPRKIRQCVQRFEQN